MKISTILYLVLDIKTISCKQKNVIIFLLLTSTSWTAFQSSWSNIVKISFQLKFFKAYNQSFKLSHAISYQNHFYQYFSIKCHKIATNVCLLINFLAFLLRTLVMILLELAEYIFMILIIYFKKSVYYFCFDIHEICFFVLHLMYVFTSTFCLFWAIYCLKLSKLLEITYYEFDVFII